jgi:hypothetical protein
MRSERKSFDGVEHPHSALGLTDKLICVASNYLVEENNVERRPIRDLYGKGEGNLDC